MRPFLVSMVEPSGMSSVAESATNSWLPVRLTSTLPLTGRTTTSLWNVGVCVTEGAGVTIGVAVGGAVGDDAGAATTSTLLAGESVSLPAASIVRSVKPYSPAASPRYATGDVQGANSASRPGPASRHAYVTPGSGDAKLKLAVSASVLVVISAASGATVSTVHVWVTGALSTPSASTTVTSSECSPWPSSLRV